MWQPAPVLFPDAELVMVTATRGLLDDVYVDRRVPDTRHDTMVIWTRDGGDDLNGIDRPRMRCLVFAPTDQAATDLARQVVAKVPLMVDGKPIVRTQKLSGPYEIPEESEAKVRYLLFEIHMRGQQA